MRRRDFLAASGGLGALARAAARANTTGLCLNEDNSHYFFTRAGQKLDADSVASFVDQYAGTQVRELILSANAMRTSYASEVWDPIWRGYDPQGPDDQPLLASTAPEGRKGARGWVHTAWQLHQQGLDPYGLWIARARRHRISPWVSMRMNDLHAVDDDRSFMHSEFWRAHPEYRRVPWRAASWQDRAFDFAHAEVRAYHLKLVRELAGRYDIDGLELDWMRFPYHFAPGREREGGELLTDFVREARAVLDAAGARRGGRRIRLGVRVPSRPQTAIAMGLDSARWAQLGLVDMVVITPFWASIETDMPVELWRRLLPARVALAAGLELLIRPYHSYAIQKNSLETVRGASAAMLARGADRVYLFNYMDSQTAIENLSDYQPLLRECGSLATLAGRPRRHVATYADTWAPGEAQAAMLPKAARAGEWFTLRVQTGPAWQSAQVRIACDGARPAEVRVNGVACEYAGTVAKPEPGEPWPREEFHAWNAVNGAGRDTVIDARAAGETKVHWVEVAVAG